MKIIKAMKHRSFPPGKEKENGDDVEDMQLGFVTRYRPFLRRRDWRDEAGLKHLHFITYLRTGFNSRVFLFFVMFLEELFLKYK